MPRLPSMLLLGVAAACSAAPDRPGAAGRTATTRVPDKGGESGSTGDIDYFRLVKP